MCRGCRLLGTVAVFCIGLGAACRAAEEVRPEVRQRVVVAMPESAPARPQAPRRLLIFSKTNGFRHGSIPVGVFSLTMLGEKTGAWTAVHSEDEALFEPESLRQFDAVLLLNTTGEIFRPRAWPADAAQQRMVREREARLKQSLVDFVSGGKGLAGIHSATDTYQNWKEFNDLMGGAFAGHPWHTEVPVRVLCPEHPLCAMFEGRDFKITDEIYQFRNETALPSDRRMLLSLDPQWDQLSKGSRKDGFYPIAWLGTYGRGRTWYCSLGHRDEIFHHPLILRHYLAGVQYALGDLKADATPKPRPGL